MDSGCILKVTHSSSRRPAAVGHGTSVQMTVWGAGGAGKDSTMDSTTVERAILTGPVRTALGRDRVRSWRGA